MSDPFAEILKTDVGPWFEAAFDSDCPCGFRIHEGDQARYVDGEASCEDCGTEAEGW